MRFALICLMMISGTLATGVGVAQAVDSEAFQKWCQSFEEGRTQFYAGHAEKARQILISGLKEGRTVKHEDDRFVRHLTLLGASLFMKRRYKEAIPYYREAFVRLASLPTACHPDPRVVFVARSRLGQCLYSQGKYRDAITQFEQALRVNGETITEDDRADCLRGLADSNFASNDYIEAESYYELALAHAGRAEIRSSRDYLRDLLSQLAYLKARRMEFDAASDYIARARVALAGSSGTSRQEEMLNRLTEYISKTRDYRGSLAKRTEER